MYIQDAKKNLRKTIKKNLVTHCQQEAICIQEAMQATALLTNTVLYKEATSILAYAALSTEFSVDLLIQQALVAGKKLFLPKTFSQDSSMEFYQLKNNIPYSQQVVYGNYGIREPLFDQEKYVDTPKTIILVPGLAFTPSGQRLGKGMGFYDRFLSKLHKKNCTFIGIAFQCQIVDTLPTEPTDIQVDFLLTPEQIICCKNHDKF